MVKRRASVASSPGAVAVLGSSGSWAARCCAVPSAAGPCTLMSMGWASALLALSRPSMEADRLSASCVSMRALCALSLSRLPLLPVSPFSMNWR